jgi:chromosome segregation ATPase
VSHVSDVSILIGSSSALNERLKEELLTKEVELKEVLETVLSQAETVAGLRAKMEVDTSKGENLQNTVQELTSQLEVAQEKLNHLRASGAQAQESSESIREALTQQEKLAAEATERNLELSSTIDKLVSNQEQSNARSERELSNVQSALESMRVDKDVSEELAATLNASVAELEGTLASTRATLASESQLRQSLEQRIEG